MRALVARRALIVLGALGLAALVASCAPVTSVTPPEHTTRPGPRPAPKPEPSEVLASWYPALGPPRRDSLGRIDWTPLPRLSAARARITARIASGVDSLAVWQAEAADPASSLRPFALKRIALVALGRADTAVADARLDTLARLQSPWSWEALRMRTDLAVARGRFARADSLLDAADRRSWPDLERAAWLMRRVRVAAVMGDTVRAVDYAKQAILRYPATAPAASAVRWLDEVAARRRTPPTESEQLAAADVERFDARPDDALRRLARVEASLPRSERGRIALRIADLAQATRRFETGLAAVARAAAGGDSTRRMPVSLTRARLLRDSGRGAEAMKEFERVAKRAASDDLRLAAAWEWGIELEGTGRTADARAAYAIVAAQAGGHREDARLRRGLLALVQGDSAQAVADWNGGRGEAFDFWRAVVHATHSDSLLRTIARRPGYGWYRVAARESLGVRGWPDVDPAADTLRRGVPAALVLAEDLAALGDSADASLVLQRWSAASVATPGDSAAPSDSAAPGRAVAEALRASRIAYAIGQVATGIRFGQRALDAAARVTPELQWRIQPWLYPRALDSLYVAAGVALDRADSVRGIDEALLRAVAWQESRFAANARSRSNALGLYQLKLGTAGDMARRLREPVPDERALFDPAASLRYGREYVRWLLGRTGGDLVVAIAAYNSGPGALPPGWPDWVARGGDALFAELIGRSETRDYVRRILGARAAYREFGARPLDR